MPGERPLNALICDFDPWSLRATEGMARDAGFTIVGEATTAVEALQLAPLVHPTLVVMAHEHAGLSGLEAIPDLRRGDDPPEVVLISLDDSGRAAAKEAGAYELAVKGEGDVLERILAEIRELLETGERRKANDRRSGQDRRQHQDWSKVTYERRSGQDRRSGLRREQDVTSTAKDVLRRQQLPSDPP